MASIMIHKIDAATGAGIYGVKFVLYDSGKNPIGEYTTDQDGYIYIDDELVPGKYYLRELEAADGYIRDEQYKTVYVERGKCAQIEWENSAVTGQIQIRKYSSEDNTVTGQLAGTPLEGAVFELWQGCWLYRDRRTWRCRFRPPASWPLLRDGGVRTEILSAEWREDGS